MQDHVSQGLSNRLKNKKVMISGMDGYLGWPLALQLAVLGCNVSGVDNYSRRECVSEKQADSVVPIYSMQERVAAAKDVLSVSLKFREFDIRDLDKLRELLKEEKPDVIVHYGEIPSAPYSMVDAEHAILVQDNNVLGTLGLLWAIKEIVPNALLLKLGTMGEYGTPLSGRPLFEGFFPDDSILKWQDREWSLAGELTPRDSASFYHISKIQDTYNVFKACKLWGLRSYDIMQGVIYGVHTDETAADPRLRTRFDIDEWFGTVMNRFVSQAILGIPMTIYGEGGQIRGFIALEDAMECMVRIIATPLKAGEYDVVNQVSKLYKVSDIAEMVANVAKKFGIQAQIQRIENPRVESEQHPYEVISRKLPAMGFKSNISAEKEIERMFELLSQPDIKKGIEKQSHLISPITHWTGKEKKSEVLETYQPGTKQSKGHHGVLDTKI